jgi:hypothetical protein
MASQKQIEANRRNSQHSTGPRTPAGKAISRGNAMRTGIYAQSLAIRGEDPRYLEQLTAEYFREWDPVTPRERDLVDSIVRNEWILRRMGLVEAELWNHYFKSTGVTLPGSRWDVLKRDFMLAQGFIAVGANLERLQRRISAVERSTQRARAELTELRVQRESVADEQREREELAASDASAPSPQPADPEPTSPIIGFVPSPRVEQASTLAMPAFEPACPGNNVPPTDSNRPETTDEGPSPIGSVPSIPPGAAAA